MDNLFTSAQELDNIRLTEHWLVFDQKHKQSQSYKNDNSFSFYGFVLIYLSIGAFILYQSLH